MRGRRGTRGGQPGLTPVVINAAGEVVFLVSGRAPERPCTLARRRGRGGGSEEEVR